MLRKIFITLAILAAFAWSTLAQDKVKIGANFVNSEYALNPLEAVEYLQGISAELNARIAAQKEGKGVRLGGVFYWKRDNFDAPTDTYAFGPRLSYRLSVFEPFGHALFGFNTTYNSDRTFTRIYGAGLDVNLGAIYVRPIEVNWQRTEGIFSPATQTYSAGLGVRF
jgi:hypothetical protein